MPIGTLAAYLGFHLGRCRVVLAGDVGFLLGLGLHLLFLGAVRSHLLEHDAFGKNVVSVHTLSVFFSIKLKIVVELVLEVVHLVDVIVLNGDIIVLSHGTQLVL